MKSHRRTVAAAALAALLGGALAPRPQDDAAAIRAELAQVRLEVATLTAELAETRELVNEIVTYLGDQAQAAETMTAVLAAAEEQGFTAGINFKSRETLLAGWREQLDRRQKDLPGSAPAGGGEASGRGAGGGAPGTPSERP